MFDLIRLGLTLHDARRQKKMTQEEAAEIIDVSVETIRNIEHGDTSPNIATVFALCDIYGLYEYEIWRYYKRDRAVDERLREMKVLHSNIIIERVLR